jgi:hypothetical protein
VNAKNRVPYQIYQTPLSRNLNLNIELCPLHFHANQVVLLERKPGLAVILVGSDPASAVYVRNKGIACKEAGFYSEEINIC